jgi:hypothetical protein
MKRGLCKYCYEEDQEDDEELNALLDSVVKKPEPFDGSDPELQALLDTITTKEPRKKKKHKKKKKAQTSSNFGAWPNCQKCTDKTEMVLRTNRKTLTQFWGCSNFPNCRFTLPCSTYYPYKARNDTGGPCPYCEAHIDQPYDFDGKLMLWANGKPANRCDRCEVNLVWIESRDSESKWFELFPENVPVVSKKQEGHMPTFIKKKWYIVQKPSGSADTQETRAGRVIWDKTMDQYDGKPLEVDHMTRDGKLAYFKGIHSYAFHSDWTKGPFDTRQDAYQSMIKIVARREPDVEADIEEFENGLIEFYDKAVCEKIDADSIHLKDPKTGVVSVIDKHKLETGGKRKKRNMAKKIRDRWKNKKPDPEAKAKYDKWCEGRPNIGETKKLADGQSVGDILLDENDGHMKTWDGTEWRTITSPRSNQKDIVLQSAPGGKALIQGVDIKELAKKVDELANPEEALVEKAKDLDEQYNEDIDGIFQDYHERNKRRDELKERISRELGKDKEEESGGWLYPVLAVGGSLAALGWAGYTLYPHLEGIRYYVGF